MPVVALRRKTFNGVEPTFMQNRQYEDRLKYIYKNMIFVMFLHHRGITNAVKQSIKMKVQISFKVINQEYNKDYANEYHFGKESENNSKYLSEATYSISNIKSVELLNEGTFKLILRVSTGNKTEIPIPNVVIFRCHTENGTYLDFAVSKSILNRVHQTHNEKYKTTRCYFYINSEPESLALTDNLVLDVNEIPENILNRI